MKQSNFSAILHFYYRAAILISVLFAIACGGQVSHEGEPTSSGPSVPGVDYCDPCGEFYYLPPTAFSTEGLDCSAITSHEMCMYCIYTGDRADWCKADNCEAVGRTREINGVVEFEYACDSGSMWK